MRQNLALAVALLLWGLAPRAAAGRSLARCEAGNLNCLCEAAGGTWKDHKPPLEPVCTFAIHHQGAHHGCAHRTAHHGAAPASRAPRTAPLAVRCATPPALTPLEH